MKRLFILVAVMAGSAGCSQYLWADDQAVPLEMMLFEPMVKVASQEAEPLKEVPVVTSVITADEIRRMGARTLDDVLQTIPGFSHIQDQNENYSAERGIYGSSQQSILVLRDGHRLNNRSYLEANFDYSISLENVDHIEIMRGPGGSVYGDVAFNAVINIVTKDPKALNGVEAKVGVGNYDQKKASVVAGYDLKDLGSFLLSGAFYENAGQVINSADSPDPRSPNDKGAIWMYGFNDKPSYDIYLKYDWKDLEFKASQRYCHMIEQRTSGGASGYIYSDINAWAEMDGETPGLSSEFDNYELAYSPEIAGYKWTTRVYYDTSRIDVNLGTTTKTLAQSLVQWSERVGGLQSQVNKSYEFLGKGDVLFGVQAENMDVYQSTFATGIDPSLDNPSPTPALATGEESSYAVFGQDKHRLLDNLILNWGVRYDYKTRRADPNGVIPISDVSQVSPRAALIYNLNQDFNFRLSYGHCFVDAPYWYRYNNLPGYSGAMTLQPETQDSYQFTVGENLWSEYWTHQVNFYYINYKDVVFRNANSVYSNAGAIQSNGIEYEMAYKRDNVDARFNYTFQNFTNVEGFGSDWDMMENVPENMGNLIVDVAPCAFWIKQPWAKELWVNVGLRYIGKQFARWDKLATNPPDVVDPAFLCNFGVTAEEVIPHLTVGVHAFNLLNAKYYQGGSVDYPYEQPGMWFMGDVTYKF